MKNLNYKSMLLEELSKEANRLINDGWFKNYDKICLIYTEMKVRYKLKKLDSYAHN